MRISTTGIQILSVLFISGFSIWFQMPCYSQKTFPPRWDSALESNCEKWKLEIRYKTNKIGFGPFNVALIEKLDSPAMKKKTKDREFGIDLGYDARETTGKEVAMDITKNVTTQKIEYYRMLMKGTADTNEVLYSIVSFTKEQKETVGGAVLKSLTQGHYESENNGSGMTGYMEVINGAILQDADALLWTFFFTLGKGSNGATPGFSTGDTIQSFQHFKGYLKNSNDSIFIKPVISMSVSKLFGKRDTLYFMDGFELVNAKGEHVAAYQNIGPDKKSPFIWMSKYLNNNYQEALASFLTAIIQRKQYQTSKTIN